MKVLIVGSGGREHALAWKIKQSKQVKKIFCAPGNGGTATLGENVNIQAEDIHRLVEFARKEKIDLTVVGPEAPLVLGIVDRFRTEGLRIFGPSMLAARLEGSKVFSKMIMKHHGIPTADFKIFSEYGAAEDYIRAVGAPLVVKADGLAAGKGVVVAQTVPEACEAAHAILEERVFGDAGSQIIIEECLVGEEASILAFTDGKSIVLLESCQDHKRIFDNDQGPNTGGMGAYSPAPVITPEIENAVIRKVLIPTIHGMSVEGCPYSGILYAGLMITPSGPSVLEFNVRFGDPETQPLLMRLKTDLVTLFEKTIDGKLDTAEIDWSPEPAVCVVMASEGYPGNYPKGRVITGLDQPLGPACEIFQAGTKREEKKTLTTGGRVLGVTATGADLKTAIDAAYAAVRGIAFEGAQYRTDIGARALNR
ncbi:MAG: phosphoribosylamine--glycine ligase [Planctomycetota bacterium]